MNEIALDPPRSGHLLAATMNDGIQRSEDGGQTWDASTAGLLGQTTSAAIDPTRPGLVLAGLNGMGMCAPSTAVAHGARS